VSPTGVPELRLGRRLFIAAGAGAVADAVAAVFTVSKGAGWNFVTFFPSGEAMPDTSSVNASPDDGAARWAPASLEHRSITTFAFIGWEDLG